MHCTQALVVTGFYFAVLPVKDLLFYMAGHFADAGYIKLLIKILIAIILL